jgi:hypothetical protein
MNHIGNLCLSNEDGGGKIGLSAGRKHGAGAFAQFLRKVWDYGLSYTQTLLEKTQAWVAGLLC